MSSVDGSRIARAKCDVLALGRVQTSVRPVDAVVKKTAGPDGDRDIGVIRAIAHPSFKGER